MQPFWLRESKLHVSLSTSFAYGEVFLGNVCHLETVKPNGELLWKGVAVPTGAIFGVSHRIVYRGLKLPPL